MGDDDNRMPFLLEPRKNFHDKPGFIPVKPGGRFVKHHDRGFHRDHTGNRKALPLPA